MSKWYIGLDGKGIVEELETMATQVVINSDYSDCEERYDALVADYKFIREKVIDLKTEFYMHNKEIYNMWSETLVGIDKVMNAMESDLEALGVQF